LKDSRAFFKKNQKKIEISKGLDLWVNSASGTA